MARPEMAANLSGGGFSSYFSTPEYQLGDVLTYLQKHTGLYDGLYKCVLAAKLTAVIWPSLTS